MAEEEPSTTTVRDATPADADAIAHIYNHYVAHTIVTFEKDEVRGSEMARRIAEVQSLPLPWLVAESKGTVVGYAYAACWRARHAYRLSVEVSAYLDPGEKARGIGTSLYTRLVSILRNRGIHVVIGGVALPNRASVALHEKLGFNKVAHFNEVGFKFGQRIDVGYWQLIL